MHQVALRIPGRGELHAARGRPTTALRFRLDRFKTGGARGENHSLRESGAAQRIAIRDGWWPAGEAGT